jgi:hypothetical protein
MRQEAHRPDTRERSMLTGAIVGGLLALAGLGATLALESELSLVFLTMFLSAVALGFVVGRWWAVPFALVWLIPAAFVEDPDFTLVGRLVFAGVVFVGPTAASIALGVDARGRMRRRSRRAAS